MLRAFSTSATGMNAQQTLIDTISNNLANMNTNGFKKTQVNFEDLLYIQKKEAGSEVAAGVVSPSGVEIGSGVREVSTAKVFTQGELVATDRDLDIAIQGSGFFEINMPNGDVRYTRDGSFMRDSDGNMVTSSGYQINPPITIPSDAETVSVGADGSVSALTSSGISNLGQITLTRFTNPEGLRSEGGNLYSETEASGSPTTTTPGENGAGNLLAKHLEKSNVQMVTELVNLITAQRAYETNSRAISAGDQMLQTANNLVR